MLGIRAMRELIKVIAGLVEHVQQTLPVVARLWARNHLRAIGQHGLAKKLGLAQARRRDFLEVYGTVRFRQPECDGLAEPHTAVTLRAWHRHPPALRGHPRLGFPDRAGSRSPSPEPSSRAPAQCPGTAPTHQPHPLDENTGLDRRFHRPRSRATPRLLQSSDP